MNTTVLDTRTFCDETGVAIVHDRELLADIITTSMDEYARYGGIIPEIASRAHLQTFVPALDETLEHAGITLSDVDAIAVTADPGLIGPPAVGVSATKALTLATGKPLYGVNHIINHLCVGEFIGSPLPEHFIGPAVSGGHSPILRAGNIATDIEEFSRALDGVAGETFDKVGRLLDLPYPDGPHIDRLVRLGSCYTTRFPRGPSQGRSKVRRPYDFSFSGLKTTVTCYIEDLTERGGELNREDVTASSSETVCDVLAAKALTTCEIFDYDTLVIGGGFSTNSRLCELAIERVARTDVTVRIPSIRYCTSNRTMVTSLGWELVRNGVEPSSLNIAVDTGMNLGRIKV